MSVGIEKIEAILEDLKELIVAGKKVQADGKVDVADIAHIIAILPKLPKMIEDFKAIGDAIEQGKDLDVSEIVTLVQKISALVKEVEKA